MQSSDDPNKQQPDPTFFPTPQAKSSYYTQKCMKFSTTYLRTLSTEMDKLKPGTLQNTKQIVDYMKADSKLLKDASFWGISYGGLGSLSAYYGLNKVLKINKPISILMSIGGK